MPADDLLLGVRCEANRLCLSVDVDVDARIQRRLIEAINTGEQNTADGRELRLLRGDLLPDWDEPWLAAARQELRLLWLLSIEAVAVARLADQRPGRRWRSRYWPPATNRCRRGRIG